MQEKKEFDYILRPGNALSEYITNKDESLKSVAPRQVQKVAFPKTYNKNTNPETLLVLPPITIPVGMAKRCIPPMGISYIAASLRLAGFPVSLMDTSVEGYNINMISGDNNLVTYGLNLKQIRQRLAYVDPDLIGVSLMFSTDIDNLMQVCEIAKSLHPDIPIVVGGLHPTIYPKEILQESVVDGTPCIDFVIRGEGERRLVTFLENMKQGFFDLNAESLCGWHNGEIFANPQIGRINDLDALPFPAYDLLPMEKYFEINVPFSPVPKGKRVLPVLASRGCPVGCNFCANTNVYQRFIARSPANVSSEIKQLKEKYDIDEIQFADDNLTFNRKRSCELFARLEELDLCWCTPNGIMINTISEEMIEAMHRSGLYQITLSFDSGNAKSLKKYHNKPVKLNTVPGLVNKAKELGIFSHGTLVVGMPGETVEDIQESLDFAYTLDLTSLSVFIAAAIPGSVLYHAAIDNGLITKGQARQIDTTRSKIMLSDVPNEKLEKMIVDFQKKYAEKTKKRSPELFEKKYEMFIKDNAHAQEMIDFRLT